MNKYLVLTIGIIGIVVIGYTIIGNIEKTKEISKPADNTPTLSPVKGSYFVDPDDLITFVYPDSLVIVDKTTLCARAGSCAAMQVKVTTERTGKYTGKDIKEWYLKAVSNNVYRSWEDAKSSKPGLTTKVALKQKSGDLYLVTGDDRMSAGGIYERQTFIPYFLNDGKAKVITVSLDTRKFPGEEEPLLYEKVNVMSDTIVDSIKFVVQ